MDVVVDDHLLLEVLLDEEPPDLRAGGGRLFTTGLWYHRLCRALGSDAVVGAMSRRLGRAGPAVAASAVRAMTTLPETIGVTSLRDLAWPMAQLVGEGVRLNLLSLEALAAADHLHAQLCLGAADDNPPLAAVAASRGSPVRIIGR